MNAIDIPLPPYTRQPGDLTLAERQDLEVTRSIFTVTGWKPKAKFKFARMMSLCPPVLPSFPDMEDSRGWSSPSVLTLDIAWSDLVGVDLSSKEICALDLTVHLLLTEESFSKERFEGGYVPFSLAQVEQVIGLTLAQPVLAILRLTGIAETNCSWRRPDVEAKKQGIALGWRLTDEALQRPLIFRRLLHPFTGKMASRRKIRAAKIGAKEAGREAQRAIYAALKEVTIDSSAKPMLRAIPSRTEMRRAVHRYMAAAAIQRRQWWFGCDPKTGRVFHNVANLHRETRLHLRLQGERTVQLDLTCSQPTLLHVAAYSGATCDESRRMWGLIETRTFYTEICRLAGYGVVPHEDAKEKVYAGLLFATDYPNQKMEAVFAAHFPKAWAFIEKVRLTGKTMLPLSLQRREADIMIYKVTPALRDAGILSVSVHDAVLIKASQAEQARAIVASVFQRETGVTPVLHLDAGALDPSGSSEAVAPEDSYKERLPESLGVVEIALSTVPETAMDPAADVVVKHCVAVPHAPAREPHGIDAVGSADVVPKQLSPSHIPCPADLCPGCWGRNVVSLIESYFGCAHQPPRPPPRLAG